MKRGDIVIFNDNTYKDWRNTKAVIVENNDKEYKVRFLESPTPNNVYKPGDEIRVRKNAITLIKSRIIIIPNYLKQQ